MAIAKAEAGERLADDLGHRKTRIERRERVLVDRLNPLTPAALLGGGQFGEVAAIERHPAAAGLDQTEDDACKGGLARPGFTDQPTYADAKRIGGDLLDAFVAPTSEGGVDEIHVVYTRFVSMVTQEAHIQRVLPLEVVDEIVEKSDSPSAFPLYEFEPDAEAVLDALLPRYIDQTVYSALLMAAASEHAARRRAMKSATDNAEELIKSRSRQANQARQAEITQEISEIVGGADALSASA
jgi:ATP synthase F1 gamma subunit